MSRTRKILLATIVAILVALIGTYTVILSGALDVAAQRSGHVTYAVDCELGPAAVGGAHDAFSAWDKANDGLILEESASWSEADVRVARMDSTVVTITPIDGCACIGVSPMCPALNNVLFGLGGCNIPNGGTIGIIINEPDMDEEQYPYARALLRDLIAHEFGHNLGMSHNTANSSHMMRGQHAMYPYMDRGYVIPERISGDDDVLAALAAKWGMPESCVRP